MFHFPARSASVIGAGAAGVSAAAAGASVAGGCSLGLLQPTTRTTAQQQRAVRRIAASIVEENC
jgi:hypothetical protein